MTPRWCSGERMLYLSSAKGNFLVSKLLVSICHRTVGVKFLCESGMLIAFGHVKLGWNRHFTKFFFLSRNCRFWIFLTGELGWREERRVFIIARLITHRRAEVEIIRWDHGCWKTLLVYLNYFCFVFSAEIFEESRSKRLRKSICFN